MPAGVEPAGVEREGAGDAAGERAVVEEGDAAAEHVVHGHPDALAAPGEGEGDGGLAALDDRVPSCPVAPSCVLSRCQA